MRAQEFVLDEACWAGYRKDGMKTMFGKRYPNCVKKKKKSESVEQGVAEGVTSPEIKQAYDAVMQTTPRSPERRAAIAKYQKLRADALKNKQQGVAEGQEQDYLAVL